jgi:Protein of unknown function (DUF4235)
MKRLFAPVSILTGLAAGLLARKGFERIWALADEEQPPDPGDREVHYPKLVAALLLEGAVFSLVKGLVDRGARLGFASATGAWPGDEGEDDD